jgi:hypothetical protein
VSNLRPRIWFERVTAERLPVLHIGNEAIELDVEDVRHTHFVTAEALNSHHVEIRRKEKSDGRG